MVFAKECNIFKASCGNTSTSSEPSLKQPGALIVVQAFKRSFASVHEFHVVFTLVTVKQNCTQALCLRTFILDLRHFFVSKKKNPEARSRQRGGGRERSRGRAASCAAAAVPSSGDSPAPAGAAPQPRSHLGHKNLDF